MYLTYIAQILEKEYKKTVKNSKEKYKLLKNSN